MTYSVSRAPVPTNHILHLLLTLVSCGLWAPVWLLVALINANTDRATTTQTYGHATTPAPAVWQPIQCTCGSARPCLIHAAPPAIAGSHKPRCATMAGYAWCNCATVADA